MSTVRSTHHSACTEFSICRKADLLHKIAEGIERVPGSAMRLGYGAGAETLHYMREASLRLQHICIPNVSIDKVQEVLRGFFA
jgi:hypothetical protein